MKLDVTHNLLSHHFSEIRFNLDDTIRTVKDRLYTITGTKAYAMKLELRTGPGMVVAYLEEDDRLLGTYPVEEGMVIHCIDIDPFSMAKDNRLEDLSKVEKYVMPEEEYEKLDNSVRRFKQRLLEDNPELVKQFEEKKKLLENQGFAEAEGMEPGMRFEAFGGNRGTVRYVGRIEGLKPGCWIGVEYDEPVGKNDGSVKGKRYFECGDKFGHFLRPHLVHVGDYPEVDIMDMSDLDEL